ncbi:MAG: hypothetical protein H6685_08165 [Deltaproteobacteria bacterium]|nr:hypothetical protein [Deltaproteobacteria bacterium]
MAVVILVVVVVPRPSVAHDRLLADKAAAYQEFFEAYHSPGPGGVVIVRFEDADFTEPNCYKSLGDSAFFTGLYLGAQAMRYEATGDEDALAEVRRIAEFMHQILEVTYTPGYIARYVGPDRMPFNCEALPIEGGSEHEPGENDYVGSFWLDDTSRDQYVGWFWGLTRAFDVLRPEEDAALRERIQDDFREVLAMFFETDWRIRDQNGRTRGTAYFIENFRRLSWLLQASHVTGDTEFRDRFDELWAMEKDSFFADVWAWPNKYVQYYGMNLLHLEFDAMLRLWPEGADAQFVYDTWLAAVRQYVAGTHNAWFDAVYLGGCERFGGCADADAVADDIVKGLTDFWNAPNWRRGITASELPLDPFSVWADEWLAEHPLFESLWDIDPQTLQAHEVADRCWDPFLWHRSPYHTAECDLTERKNRTAPGVDFLLAYWAAVDNGAIGTGDGIADDDDDTADDGPSDGDNDDDDDDDSGYEPGDGAPMDDEKSDDGDDGCGC